MQEAAVEAVSGEDVAEPGEEQTGHGSSNNLAGSQANEEEASQVARFGAAKEKKHSLESGISTFNRYTACRVLRKANLLSQAVTISSCLINRYSLGMLLCLLLHAKQYINDIKLTALQKPMTSQTTSQRW